MKPYQPPGGGPRQERISLSKLVDFIVIGAQKAGTTALFDYMAEMPGLSLARTKEVHFFDDEALDWDRPDYTPYHAQFDWDGPGLRGEATPIYIYWPNALERIRRYNPKVRLVLLLRDPVQRAWSHWRMETGRGVETHPFSWCIREGRGRLFDSEPWGHHREFSYVERGFYGEQVSRLLDLFPRDQVLIQDAEALRRDPNPVLQEIAAFLGSPSPPHLAHREAHVGLEMGGVDPADAAWLRSVYARDSALLESLTGLRL
jgi:hypothetical protein